MSADDFTVKDSGQRLDFESGMVRDVEEGKADFTLIRRGPMLRRWAEHMTKGAVKYGRHNWTLACSQDELERFERSAARHFEQWIDGERDEDHAAAVVFNLNAAEYVRGRLAEDDWLDWVRVTSTDHFFSLYGLGVTGCDVGWVKPRRRDRFLDFLRRLR